MENKATQVLVTALKRLLAAEYALYTKVWGFHWNLVGTDFAERHALYGDWKDALGTDIDVLAERIRQLGDVSPAGLGEFVSLTAIKDTPSALLDEASTAQILYNDFCILQTGFYKAIDIAEEEDKVTSNILQELASHVDKTLWFLKSICTSNSNVMVAAVKAK